MFALSELTEESYGVFSIRCKFSNDFFFGNGNGRDCGVSDHAPILGMAVYPPLKQQDSVHFPAAVKAAQPIQAHFPTVARAAKWNCIPLPGLKPLSY